MSDEPAEGDPSEQLTEEFEYVEHEPPAAAAALPAGDEEVVLAEAVAEEKWEVEAVNEHLKMVGSGIHELWGKAEKDWEMSQRDLERIGPPLTRILNRYEPTARMAVVSDPLLLGYGTTLYTYRSVLQARAAMAEQREAAERHESDAGGYERVAPAPASPNGDGPPPPPPTVLHSREAAWRQQNEG